jgi:hypothetical protein
MSRFERGDKSLVEKIVRDMIDQPKIGKVKDVYEHVAEDDDSNFRANVILDGGTREARDCPIIDPGNDAIDIPEAGDKVMLIYTDDEKSKPHVMSTAWTNKDRPPLGKAGMWRRRFEISESENDSMLGSGDIYLTGYTDHDKEAFNTYKSGRKPEKAVVQLAKHASDKNVEPTEQSKLPAKVEMYDSPKDGEAHVSVELNKVAGEDSEKSWGMKFDASDGSWTIGGPKGFGIECHGDGTFTWHVKKGEGNLDFKQHDSDTGPLSL